ncbi:MAG: TrkH family potassium uptake protein [Candidatus Thermoplasmatota archaeon]|nr:TrkH family potassium uptake protein [Candidatus Thermoplasmatota archaeon]
MRFKGLAGTVGAITLLFMFTFLPPFFVGWQYGEDLGHLYITFALPFFITLVIGGLLFFIGRDDIEKVREREAVVAVAISWLLMALLGSLPYLLGGLISDPADAYFESMSGFATCGATVIGAPFPGGDYLDYPNAHSIFLWRSLTQWVGGMGIIVFSVVIISKLLGGTVQLFKAETAGETVSRIKPKIQQTASILLRIYFLFTAVQTLLLWAAGMDLYDAVNHSFTTLATGGFGTRTASIAYWDSVLIESIVITFMILGSISFVLHYKVLKGDYKSIFKDPELRMFMGSIVVFTLIIAFTLSAQGIASTDPFTNAITSFDANGQVAYNQTMDFGTALRESTFQVVSIHTTTGYATANYGAWPQSTQLILVFLMLMGGCVGSTAGAIKISRLLILSKVARREVQKVLHPKAILPIRVGSSVIPEEVVKRIGIFFFAYLALFFISSLIMTFFIDDIGVAFSAVATSMGGVGPGIGTGYGTLGPSQTFAFIPGAGKIYLALCMWAGRLEIFSAIILFFPSTYKR